MSLPVLLTIHITAVILLFYSFGAIALGASTDKAERAKGRPYKALHGIALLFILLTGLAQMHLLRTGFPAWLKIKFVVWLLLGVVVVFVGRKPQWRSWIWLLLVGLGAVAIGAAFIR